MYLCLNLAEKFFYCNADVHGFSFVVVVYNGGFSNSIFNHAIICRGLTIEFNAEL